jgi:hypothetical protein
MDEILVQEWETAVSIFGHFFQGDQIGRIFAHWAAVYFDLKK